MTQRPCIIVSLVLLAACSQEAAPRASLQGELERAARASGSSTVAPKTDQTSLLPNEAQSFGRRLQVTSNRTTFDEFWDQMPRKTAPQIGLVGRVRTYTWTFSDGSKLIARFTAAHGERSGQGLVFQGFDVQ